MNSLFRRNDKRFNSVNNFFNDDNTNNEDALGCDSGYKIVKRELTFTEKEEETELENEISNLQLQKQHRLHLGYDISDEEDGHQTQDEEEENEKDILYYRSMFKHVSACLEDEIDTINFRKSFVSQNLTVFDEIIKILILGEANVGKTLFINKMINSNKENNYNYLPTLSLEINKCIKTICGKKIKLELWDTNEIILNNDIIKTYFKIANGFVFVINKNSNMDYIRLQMDRIQNSLQKDINFFIIYNNDNENVISFEDLPLKIKEAIQELMCHFLMEIKIANLKKSDISNDQDVINYIRCLIRNKSLNKFKSTKY